MSDKKITVSIPKGCEVNLDEMQTVANGKFCSHCSKTVWDFRNWSEEELGHFFAHSEQLVCGRFAALQLDTPLPVPSQSHYGKIAAAALGFSLFLSSEAIAQKKTLPAPIKSPTINNILQSKKLIGVVLNNSGSVMPSVPIKIIDSNKNKILEVFTDRDGCFEIEFSFIQNYENYFISISSQRFESFSKKLENSDLKSQIKVALIPIRVPAQDNRERFMGDIAVLTPYIPEPTIERSLKNTTNPTYNEQEIINRGGIDQIVKDIPQR